MTAETPRAAPKAIPGPVPDPRKPRYVAPAGAVDAHMHIFGPAARFPYAPGRRYTPPDAPVERFWDLQRHLGFSRAVLVQASCHGADNAAMLDAIARSEGRFRGVAVVDESCTERQLTMLHEGGVRAVRFNFVRHLGGAPDLGFLRRIVAMIRPMGWHVVLHLDAEDIPAERELILSLPLPFVIDHMGRVNAAHGLDQPDFRALLDLMRAPNAWVKVSGAERIGATGAPPYDDAVPFARALIAAAPDRCLWGTDWPHPNVRHMPDEGDLVDMIPAFAPDAATQRALLVANPERLYGFPPVAG